MKKFMTCIICPMGCQLTAEKGESGDIAVYGNTCPRGKKYAIKELTYPTRTLTCTVRVIDGERPLVAAKSIGEVPRDMQVECMSVVRRYAVTAPVKIGDVLIKDILGTGSNIVAVENVNK